MERPGAGIVEPAELSIWIDLQKGHRVFAGEKIEPPKAQAQSLHEDADAFPRRVAESPRTPVLPVAVAQRAPILDAELGPRQPHLEAEAVAVYEKNGGVAGTLPDLLREPGEVGRKSLGVHRTHENMTVARHPERLGDEALHHAPSGRPSDAPSH